MYYISFQIFLEVKTVLMKYRLIVILTLLVALRLFHFENIVDSPHSWRQYDTKQYIDGFYEDGNSFLEPSVCWMGGHETLILEFPLPEYMVAQIYHVFGSHLWIARLFFLSFFILSIVYFYKSMQFIFDKWIPELAILIFGLAPLSLFFSRAIHIDFFALAFSFGMLYYAMKAIRTNNNVLIIMSLLFGTIAFLVKAPYAFFLALPILIFAYQECRLKWFIYRSPLFIVPVLSLFAWNGFAFETNSLIPDWEVIPNFNKFTEMWYWYFGTWHQRSIDANWVVVFERIYQEVLGFVGFTLSIIGFLFSKKNKSIYWSLAWLTGSTLYLVIFFNLNVIHNYYQLPFVAPLAIFCALGVSKLMTISKMKFMKFVIAGLVVCCFAFEQINFSESNYYRENKFMHQIATEINEHSEKTDLVVVSYGGLTPQCPLILQPAKRKGWSIPLNDLSGGLIHQLYLQGNASKLAIVHDGGLTGELKIFYDAMENKEVIELKPGTFLYLSDLKLDYPEKSK